MLSKKFNNHSKEKSTKNEKEEESQVITWFLWGKVKLDNKLTWILPLHYTEYTQTEIPHLKCRDNYKFYCGCQWKIITECKYSAITTYICQNVYISFVYTSNYKQNWHYVNSILNY